MISVSEIDDSTDRITRQLKDYLYESGEVNFYRVQHIFAQLEAVMRKETEGKGGLRKPRFP